MLQLIRRCPEYAAGYKDYCQELYDYNVVFFRPSNPKYLGGNWFERTKEWYDREQENCSGSDAVPFLFGGVQAIKKTYQTSGGRRKGGNAA